MQQAERPAHGEGTAGMADPSRHFRRLDDAQCFLRAAPGASPPATRQLPYRSRSQTRVLTLAKGPGCWSCTQTSGADAGLRQESTAAVIPHPTYEVVLQAPLGGVLAVHRVGQPQRPRDAVHVAGCFRQLLHEPLQPGPVVAVEALARLPGANIVAVRVMHTCVGFSKDSDVRVLESGLGSRVKALPAQPRGRKHRVAGEALAGLAGGGNQ